MALGTDEIGASLALRPTGGLQRERSKETRRQAILAAADTLIRETGGTEFTMVELAKRAGVSAPTPYNLFGTKAAILYRLLNASTDVILERTDPLAAEPDPVQRVMKVIDKAIDVFVGDPELYKPLFRYLLGVSDPLNRPEFIEKASHVWQRALVGLEKQSEIARRLTEERLIRHFKAVFTGFLDGWILGETTTAAFRANVMIGVALLLLAIVGPEAMPRLENYVDLGSRA